MMVGEKQLCDLIDALEAHMLRRWVEAGLVRARAHEPLEFDEADVARVRLICDLHYDMALDEETLPLVVSLMDQLYSLRGSARAVSPALSHEPDEVRERIARRALDMLAS